MCNFELLLFMMDSLLQLFLWQLCYSQNSFVPLRLKKKFKIIPLPLYYFNWVETFSCYFFNLFWTLHIIFSHHNFVRTYVIHLLGTCVTILCNWLILWQSALYLYLGRSRMCLILQKTVFQNQVLKTCKSVQETSWRSVYH